MTAQQMFFQVKKRTRVESEPNSDTDFLGTQDTSASTSTWILTVLLTPSLRINDLDINIHSDSTETIVSAYHIDKEKENLAFKFDKLNDEMCRYESHEAFLNRCIENSLVPNGLKVHVEPSIGNMDDTFLAQ